MTTTFMIYAGVSPADANSLWAVRNSAVRLTPLYLKLQQRVDEKIAAFSAEKRKGSALTA